ncbi:hypothetical protein FJT64_000660 [Amphibalanus amphitrite]|uniref:Uncharacterized protein n=1 Tax=Amphibalanus amphitrite TaxID=1232801 RepID=A0A6A4W0A9_AMPAM|nr:hypothetical protein FJT64_000660 [Amphibalanus amphitrite]
MSVASGRATVGGLQGAPPVRSSHADVLGLAGLRHALTVHQLAGAALAPATIRSYRAVWGQIRVFLTLPPTAALFPISVADTADFLASRHEQGCSASTLAAEASAISYGHKLAGAPDPTADFRGGRPERQALVVFVPAENLRRVCVVPLELLAAMLLLLGVAVRPRPTESPSAEQEQRRTAASRAAETEKDNSDCNDDASSEEETPIEYGPFWPCSVHPPDQPLRFCDLTEEEQEEIMDADLEAYRKAWRPGDMKYVRWNPDPDVADEDQGKEAFHDENYEFFWWTPTAYRATEARFVFFPGNVTKYPLSSSSTFGSTLASASPEHPTSSACDMEKHHAKVPVNNGNIIEVYNTMARIAEDTLVRELITSAYLQPEDDQLAHGDPARPWVRRHSSVEIKTLADAIKIRRMRQMPGIRGVRLAGDAPSPGQPAGPRGCQGPAGSRVEPDRLQSGDVGQHQPGLQLGALVLRGLPRTAGSSAGRCSWLLCWSAWPLRKHLPLPVLGVPLERGYSLAAALLPARPLRWLCPDLWLALLLLYRLGLTMPPLMAARITELRSATMQCFPENWQPDQQIVTTVVKI